jgi:two-component system heavy metal sensor histidine kinase CusS
MKTLSLTARISLLFAAGAAAVLLGLGWVVERSVESHFQEMDRHEMEGKLTLLRALFAGARGPEALSERMAAALVGHHHLSVTVRAADGRRWFSYGGAEYPADLAAGDGPEATRWATWSAAGREFRGLSARLSDSAGADNAVVIALDISHHRQFMDDFHRALAIATALAALLTAALGWGATRAGLGPLRQVTQLATRLSASRLGERLPASGVPAEIDALTTAFNAMLVRLEDSFRRLSEFSSDIAHELRTPLSNLMTQTQVVLTRARSAEEYREVLASNMEEYERLARMIGDMLFLAQADNSLVTPRKEEVDLAREVARLLEFYEALAAESGVRLEAVGAVHVAADRLMLQRALSNLISNAIRHTRRGGTVSVRLAGEAGQAVISVDNPGEIPAQHLPRLFDRFYTGDPARRASGEGAGLGLAITRSIVAAHGGSITASSEAGVTRFRVVLPAA